jgi:hypothetical protein
MTMAIQDELPDNVVQLMRSGILAEFSTVSTAGVPIDTPVLYFPSNELNSFDLTTGLSYPAKAERARKNPKVGLLIEGGPGEPVISIAGMAAVRDSDLQANADRYISEASHTLPFNPDWALARKAVWYWTRILVEVTPARVLWWDNAAATDRAPQRWDAPADIVYPQSDAAPPGKVSDPSNWPPQPWQQLVGRALERRDGGHLTVVDSEGYPLPIRCRTVKPIAEGFIVEMPKGLPWSITGAATLSFRGFETFVGQVTTRDGAITMHVERALPTLPAALDMMQLWKPTPNTYEELMRRLRHEIQRRGQPLPSIPAERPAPTEYYKLRIARFKAYGGSRS